MAEEPVEGADSAAAPESMSVDAVPDQVQSTGEPEAHGDNNESKETPTKTDDSGKKVYTEEERLKRKAYFKELRERKRLAREKYNKQNARRPLMSAKRRNLNVKEDIKISFNMTEEENKVLEFYKVKLSALKSTNEQLHKRLAFLVRENMRLLQLGPPKN